MWALVQGSADLAAIAGASKALYIVLDRLGAVAAIYAADQLRRLNVKLDRIIDNLRAPLSTAVNPAVVSFDPALPPSRVLDRSVAIGSGSSAVVREGVLFAAQPDAAAAAANVVVGGLPVALKILRRAGAHDYARAEERFKREAALTAARANAMTGEQRCFVRVYGVCTILPARQLAIVLERCVCSLEDVLRDPMCAPGGRLPDSIALALLARIAGALSQLHRDSDDGLLPAVAHGDVKPSNVLMTAEGLPVLADLGLAALDDSELRLQTLGGAGGGGTPGYMAPELFAVRVGSWCARGSSVRSTSV